MSIFRKLSDPVFGADPINYHERKFQRGDKRFVMSRSELVRFSECPSKWVRNGFDLNDEESTKQMKKGSLLDVLLLTPDRFEKCFSVIPENYTVEELKCARCGSVSDSQKCSKCKQDRVPELVDKKWNWNAKFCSDWKERQSLELIKKEWILDAEEASERLLHDEVISKCIHDSDKQVQFTVEYFDQATGLSIPFKGMIDMVPRSDNSLVDLKCYRTADPEKWRRIVEDDALDVQAACYLAAWNAATGEKRNEFRHIISEQESPFEYGRRTMSDEFLAIGKLKLMRMLATYARCLSTGSFDSYDDAEGLDSVDGWTITQPMEWTQKRWAEAL